MAEWLVTNTKSGQDLGVYEAETDQGALYAMMLDAGVDKLDDAIVALPVEKAKEQGK